jgi:peroxiredoxin/outer membrane lipoprotein-sorting protein
MTRRFLLPTLLATVLASGPAHGATAPDGRALIEQVERTYRGLTRYYIEGTVRLMSQGGGRDQVFDIPVVVAVSKPWRSRIELHHQAVGMQLVSDSAGTVVFTSQSNSWMRRPRAETADDPSGSPAGSPLARYFNLTQDAQAVRWVRREAVTVNGAPVVADVVEAQFTPPDQLQADSTTRTRNTFWIDAARGLVLRDSMYLEVRRPDQTLVMVQTSQFPRIRVGEALPDSLWTFTPPPGAKEMTAAMRPPEPPRVDMSGQTAPAFSLADMVGKTRSLASYKGKVVMLDFWATWCGPCRITMPHVQKLHREMKAKGLVVLGINLAETPEKIRPFLTKNGYDFPVLLDRQHQVAERYKADAIPTTVIIDRKGTIVAYFTGVRSEAELREGLKKAGL